LINASAYLAHTDDTFYDASLPYKGNPSCMKVNYLNECFAVLWIMGWVDLASAWGNVTFNHMTS